MAYWRSSTSERRAIISWHYIKAVFRGGVIYGPSPSDRALSRLKWSRSTFKRRIKDLVDADLAYRDPYGNYRLKKTFDLIQQAKEIFDKRQSQKRPDYIVKRSQSFKLKGRFTEKDVKLALQTLFFERTIAQVGHSKRRRAKKLQHEMAKQSMLRYTDPRYAELLDLGYTPVAASRASKGMCMSKATFFRWRKKSKAVQWESVREVVGKVGAKVPSDLLPGKLFVTRNGLIVKQYPSLYRMRSGVLGKVKVATVGQGAPTPLTNPSKGWAGECVQIPSQS